MGCTALVFLDVLITLTGNYGFFNLLTIALCLLLLDDTVFSRWLPTKGEKIKLSVFVLKKRSLLKVGVLGVCIMLYAVPLLTANYPSIYVYIAKSYSPLSHF